MATSMAAVDGATTLPRPKVRLPHRRVAHHHHLRLRPSCVDADDYSRSADRGEVLLLRGEHKTTRWTEDSDEKHMNEAHRQE